MLKNYLLLIWNTNLTRCYFIWHPYLRRFSEDTKRQWSSYCFPRSFAPSHRHNASTRREGIHQGKAACTQSQTSSIHSKHCKSVTKLPRAPGQELPDTKKCPKNGLQKSWLSSTPRCPTPKPLSQPAAHLCTAAATETPRRVVGVLTTRQAHIIEAIKPSVN